MTHRVSIHSPGRMTVLAALLAGLTAPAFADSSTPIVISQVYGGGANTGAPYKNDFIELYNRGTSPVDLGSWSVQYASSSGTSWQVTKLSGSLAPGHYYLVQEAAGSGTAQYTTPPAPDATGGINMSGTSGKVALVSSQSALSGAAPTSSNLVDVVGFGSASWFEGSGPTAGLSNSTAALRKGGGCLDTDDNSADFDVSSPVPRNSATPATSCGTALDAAITPICPDSVWARQGSAIAGLLQASDPDSIVNGVSIASGARAGIDLGPLTPAAGKGGSAQVELQVADSLAPGSYPVGVSFTNDTGQTASCTVTVKIATNNTIPQVQGSGPASPFAGTVQSVQGVLTAKVGSGFFVQDPNGDGDPTTSDGVFVFGASTDAQPGDLLRVTGTVSEYTPTGASRSYTEFKDVLGVEKVGGGYTIAPTNIEMPNTDLARYEGMLVHITTPLTVNGNSYLGDRGELVLGYGRNEQPTNRYAPRTQEAAALAAANASNQIVLDDGIFYTPPVVPYLDEDGTVRAGDIVTNLTGVVDYGAAGGIDPSFKLQPTEAPTFSRSNPRPASPDTVPGNVKVASGNVENFFTVFTDGTDAWGRTGQGCSLGSGISKSNCRGADNITEFQRQQTKVVAELKGIDADVMGLMEVQNNGDTTLAYLVDQLNAAYGSRVYDYIANVPATGTDAIRVAIIYKPAVVTPVGAPLADGDEINNRAPLAQAFKLNSNGARFSLVVNHLRSKGSCKSTGGAANADTDGQGCWNGQRMQQAQRLVDYLLPQVRAAGGDNFLVVGDMNSYAMEDPIAIFTSNGMVNELERFVRPRGTPYSYVFDALSGYLDHALASSALDSQVAGITEWHNNSDEPTALDYNIGNAAQDLYQPNAFRASDHDPVIVSLNLAPAFVDVTGSVKIARTAPIPNRITGKYSASVTFTNTSGAVLNGPLQFRLDGLTSGVTLDNATGTQNGAPYITLSAASLAPGASVTVTTTFSNPSKAAISYMPALFTGTF